MTNVDPTMPTVHLQHDLIHTPVITPRTLAAASLFGVSLDTPTTTALIPPISLSLTPNQVVFLTGTSGGGKSTLLRLITHALHDQPATVRLSFDPHEPLPDAALVDGFADLLADDASWSRKCDTDIAGLGALAGPLRWLGLAGLSDAWLILRRPGELSEGQRHRYRLARLIARVERLPREPALVVVLADEFLTPLDRITAAAVASATARWARQAGICFIAATAHDDLLEALQPDVLIDATPSGITVSDRGGTKGLNPPPLRERPGVGDE